MKFTSHSTNRKTRILESRISKANRDWYKSNVSKIPSEQLLPMLNGLLQSLGFKEDDYEVHLIPMEPCSTGISVTVVFDRRRMCHMFSQYDKIGKLVRVIGCPQSIIEVRLNTYAMTWTRNIIQWF